MTDISENVVQSTVTNELVGSIVALITPFNDDGQLDFVSLARLIQYHIDAGTNAIVIAGTTGEAASLSLDEQFSLVQKAVEIASSRIKIIVGISANATYKAAQDMQKLAGLDINAWLVVTPYYNKPTQEGLYLHYQYLATSTDIPLILYNVPNRTGVDLLPETVARLSLIPNIIGIKDATGDLTRVCQHRKLCGKDFILLSGDDGSAFEFCLLGGDGVISVTTNIAAREMSQVYQLLQAGDSDKAKIIDKKLSDLHKNLFVEVNPIPVKWLAHQQGLINSGNLRLPLTSLSTNFENLLHQSLQVKNLT